MKVIIETFKIEPCEYSRPIYAPEASKAIDWTNSSDRKWLQSHMHWAVNNDRQVRIMPL